MKATLVEFAHEVDTGDECKGRRPRTLRVSTILFEGGEKKVLFVKSQPGKPGRFFEVIDLEENGSLRLGGNTVDYRVPEDGPVSRVRELSFTEDDVRAALAMPAQQTLLEEMRGRCNKEIPEPRME